MVRQIKIAITAAYVLAVTLLFGACGGTTPTANQGTANAGTQTAAVSPQPSASATTTTPYGTGSTMPGGGEAIDTSKHDDEIKRLEKQAAMRPGDEARLALAKAYLARGNALTQARQYRAALGDYRRALRYDPDNEEARQWAATITGILQQMGREVPTEGDEPAPLPMTPNTIAGEEDESTTKKEQTRKGSKQ
jgi:tetratricopeptide (TPR) repeat protein